VGLIVFFVALGLLVLASQFPLRTWLPTSGDTSGPSLASSSADSLVFNTSDTLTHERWSNHWLMVRDEDRDAWHILASKGTDILFLRAPFSDDALNLEGHWAHYTDRTARAFRHGTVAGWGNWVRPNELMAISLEFECALDGARWQEALLLDRSASETPAAEFVANLESTGLVMRLTYCELVPRNLEWAEDLEKLFLAQGISRVSVPYAGAAKSAVEIDGLVEEDVWQRAAAGADPDSGVLAAQPAAGETTLMFCWDEEKAYLTCMSAASMAEPVLTLRLLTRFDTRPENATWWKLVVPQAGTSQLYKVEKGREYRQDNSIEAARLSGATRYQVEIALPFADLQLNQAPLPGNRWRISGNLSDEEGEETHTVLHWGRAPGSSPLHGELLQFRSSR
jgi:hypothetical protein